MGSKTFWLVIINLLVIGLIVFVLGWYFNWSVDWENLLGIKMQGPDKLWFYVGAALLIGGPLVSIPTFVKRCCQKCRCSRCGRCHIQSF